MKLYFLLILRCRGVNSTELVRNPRKLEFLHMFLSFEVHMFLHTYLNNVDTFCQLGSSSHSCVEMMWLKIILYIIYSIL